MSSFLEKWMNLSFGPSIIYLLKRHPLLTTQNNKSFESKKDVNYCQITLTDIIFFEEEGPSSLILIILIAKYFGSLSDIIKIDDAGVPFPFLA
jgi:hypothetical protein